MSWTAAEADPRIGHLSDKLRHMRQVVVSRLSEKWGLESDSLIKSEGSGSGAGPSGTWPSDDEEYEQPYWSEGSGSGDRPDTRGTIYIILFSTFLKYNSRFNEFCSLWYMQPGPAQGNLAKQRSNLVPNEKCSI
ncbi:hypothetical protein O3M35_010842 [Rhynocoris fuscipes]|uniref:Uncharacterized protein n=1 Tax=Rhynocoris fuscipes TaxID=488301 RepID=A0AAW1D1G3_9HEMI